MRSSARPASPTATSTPSPRLGRDGMHRWLAQPPDPVRERVEVLLKLFHGWEVGPAAMIEHVKRIRAEHVALLERYAHYDEMMTRDNEPPSPYWLMTVSCGRHTSEAYVAWCDETIAKLEQLPRGAARRRRELEPERPRPPGGEANEREPARRRPAPGRAPRRRSDAGPGARRAGRRPGRRRLGRRRLDPARRQDRLVRRLLQVLDDRRPACARTTTTGARWPSAGRTATSSSSSRR